MTCVFFLFAPNFTSNMSRKPFFAQKAIELTSDAITFTCATNGATVNGDRILTTSDYRGVISRYHLNAATLSLANATYTPLLFDTVDTADTAGVTYSAVTGVFTVVQAGLFKVHGCAAFTAAATGFRAIAILRNGQTVHYGKSLQVADATNVQSLNTEWALTCVAGDTFSVIVYQSSGGALNLIGGTLAAGLAICTCYVLH